MPQPPIQPRAPPHVICLCVRQVPVCTKMSTLASHEHTGGIKSPKTVSKFVPQISFHPASTTAFLACKGEVFARSAHNSHVRTYVRTYVRAYVPNELWTIASRASVCPLLRKCFRHSSRRPSPQRAEQSCHQSNSAKDQPRKQRRNKAGLRR